MAAGVRRIGAGLGARRREDGKAGAVTRRGRGTGPGDGGRQVRGVMLRPSYAVPFLNPGRLVRVQSETGGDWGWGVLVSFHKRRPQDKPLAGPAAAAADGGGGYVIDVLLPCAPAARVTTATGQQITVGPPGGEGFKPPVDGGGKPEIQVRTAASGADCGVGCGLRRRGCGLRT